MDYYLLVLRLLHIVFGAIWVGFALFVPFILMPALFEAGPSAGPVMATLQRRGVPTIIAAVAGTSILAGLLLLWHVSSGFKPEFMGSHMGMALSFGALAAIIAYAVGLIVVRPAMTRAGTDEPGTRSGHLGHRARGPDGHHRGTQGPWCRGRQGCGVPPSPGRRRNGHGPLPVGRNSTSSPMVGIAAG